MVRPVVPVQQHHLLLEEEVLVYSFHTLVAELGGSLGLFLGVSFMTIWDGFKSLLMWGMKLKEVEKL